MVFILGIATFPLSKAKEVSERFIEVTKEFPLDRPLGKQIMRLAARITGDQVESISLTEIKEVKYEEYLKQLTMDLVKYSNIEEFKYKHKIYLSGVDTFPMIGLEMPE
ncbi:MAG: hypothetical protein ACTSV5_10290 [Promethearchaeota archaeon]